MKPTTFSRPWRRCTRTGASSPRIGTRKNTRAPSTSRPSSRGRSIATEASSMRCSFKLLLPVLLVAAAPAVLAAQRAFPDVGTPLSQAEIQGFDRMIGPEGKELPAGRGTAKEGEAIFATRRHVCHRKGGEDGIVRRLVIGKPG